MSWERKIQKKSPWSSSVQPAQESIFKQRGFSKPVEEETPREIRPVKFHGGDTSYLNHLKVDTTRKFVYPRLDLSGVQTKLTVGAPGDKYEQEADAMASQVMSMPDSAVQREVAPEETDEEVQAKPLAALITPLVQRETMPEEEEVQTKPLGNGTIQREEMPEEEEIQTKPMSASIQREISADEEEVQTKPSIQRASDGNFEAGGNIENRLNSSKAGGSPLPDEVRTFMEPRFGADFSGVRVHTGGDAVQMNRELGAQAFTHGSDVYYGAGKIPEKDNLTAHELTHVVQQTSKEQSVQLQLDDGHDLKSSRFAGDPILEGCFDGEQDKYLRAGSQGESVEKIQRAVVDSGYALPKFGIDGRFGPETSAAIVAFKQDSGIIPPDPVVGVKTMTVLDKKFAGDLIQPQVPPHADFHPPPVPGTLPPSPPAPSPVEFHKQLIALHRSYKLQISNLIKEGLAIDPKTPDIQEKKFRNTCEWIENGQCELLILTPTNDSETRCPELGDAYFDKEQKYPSLEGAYPLTLESDNELTVLNNIFDPRIIYLPQYTKHEDGEMSGDGKLLKLITPLKKVLSKEDLKEILIHEVQHDADQSDSNEPWAQHRGDDFDSYQSEFRAYWLGGKFNQFSSSKPAANDRNVKYKDPSGKEYSKATNLRFMRQEKIFWYIVDSIELYEYVSRSYITNEDFKRMVDSYSLPVGGNLINSIRIQSVSTALSGCNSSDKRSSPPVKSVFAKVSELDNYDKNILKKEGTSSPFWSQARSRLSPKIYLEFHQAICLN
jgi:peptidoglycan hydrolase-like protein with peptidoglycan-binding domain